MPLRGGRLKFSHLGFAFEHNKGFRNTIRNPAFLKKPGRQLTLRACQIAAWHQRIHGSSFFC
jgi:hypothetical protein